MGTVASLLMYYFLGGGGCWTLTEAFLTFEIVLDIGRALLGDPLSALA